VESVPPGAKVLFDGREMGRTPLLFQFTPTGRHTLRLQAPGFETHEQVVEGTGPGRVELVFSRKVAWETGVRGIVDTAPVIGAGRIHLTDRTGRVYGLDLEQGRKLWSFASGDLSGKLSSPLLWRGGLFVNSADRRLRRLDPRQGKEVWRQELGRVPLGPPLACQDHLLVAMEEGVVAALDPAEGSRLWSADLPGRVTAPPVLGAGRLYLLLRPGILAARDPADGDPLWQAPLPDLATARPLADAGGVVVACLDGTVLAFDPRGEKRWEVRVDAPVSLPPAWTGEHLLILPAARRALFLDRGEGKVVRTLELPQAAGAGAGVAADRIFIGLESGQMLALDAATLELLWRYQGKGRGGITAPARGEGRLLILPAPGHRVVAFALR
jgi:outer membrane protein assembly factor BamB